MVKKSYEVALTLVALIFDNSGEGVEASLFIVCGERGQDRLYSHSAIDVRKPARMSFIPS